MAGIVWRYVCYKRFDEPKESIYRRKGGAELSFSVVRLGAVDHVVSGGREDEEPLTFERAAPRNRVSERSPKAAAGPALSSISAALVPRISRKQARTRFEMVRTSSLSPAFIARRCINRVVISADVSRLFLP